MSATLGIQTGLSCRHLLPEQEDGAELKLSAVSQQFHFDENSTRILLPGGHLTCGWNADAMLAIVGFGCRHLRLSVWVLLW